MPLSLSLLNVKKRDAEVQLTNLAKSKVDYRNEDKELSVVPNSVDSDCKISMFQSDQLSDTINSIDVTAHKINTTPD